MTVVLRKRLFTQRRFAPEHGLSRAAFRFVLYVQRLGGGPLSDLASYRPGGFDMLGGACLSCAKLSRAQVMAVNRRQPDRLPPCPGWPGQSLPLPARVDDGRLVRSASPRRRRDDHEDQVMTRPRPGWGGSSRRVLTSSPIFLPARRRRRPRAVAHGGDGRVGAGHRAGRSALAILG